MKTSDILLGAGALLGAYALYRYMQEKNAAALSNPPLAPQPPSTLTNPTNIPQSGTIAPPLATGTALFTPTATPASAVIPNPAIDPTEVSVVQKWAQTDGRAPVEVFAAAMVPSEYDGMYDIIINYWDKNIQVARGSAQETFWNNLRDKYDPNHIAW